MSKRSCKKVEDFYIKIFLATCPKKNSEEAIKSAKYSWELLGPDEKKVIKEKFKIYDTQCGKKIAKTLKNEEYYRKNRRRTFSEDTVHLPSPQPTQSQPHNTLRLDPECMQPSQNDFEDSAHSRLSCSRNLTESFTTPALSPQHSVHSYFVPELDEPDAEAQESPLPADVSNVKEDPEPLGPPVPPPVTLGKDLFVMVTGKRLADWRRLSDRERGPYRRAIALIKKEYLSRYSRYLRGLPDAQLYDHLCQVTNEG